MRSVTHEAGRPTASGTKVGRRRCVSAAIRRAPVVNLLTATILIVASDLSIGQAIPRVDFDSVVHEWCMPYHPAGNVPEEIFWSSADVDSVQAVLRDCAARAAEQGGPADRAWESEVLFSASKFGADRLVILALVEAGADPEFTSESGSTPLHEAARNGYVDVAEVLIGAGADVNARDDEARTPLDVATDDGAIRSLLRRLGGI